VAIKSKECLNQTYVHAKCDIKENPTKSRDIIMDESHKKGTMSLHGVIGIRLKISRDNLLQDMSMQLTLRYVIDQGQPV